MVRVKKSIHALKYRRNLLKKVKGYRFGRSKKERQAQEAVFHAGASAFAHRRRKKTDMRQLWTMRLSAALQPYNLSYSKFIGGLKRANIGLDRKVLSEIAISSPEIFEAIVSKAKS